MRFDSAALPSLREHPELYPGSLPAHIQHYLYSQGHLWSMELSRSQTLADAQLALGPGKPIPLAAQLDALGRPPLANRVPVVAVGSNAYPRQLHDKFQRASADDTIPSFRARLHNCEVAYCAYMAQKGYIPATPRYAPEQQAHIWVQWLTREQLALIRASEESYHQIRLGPHCPLFVEDISKPVEGGHIFWHPTLLGWPDEPPPTLDFGGRTEGQGPHTRTQKKLLRDLAHLHFPDFTPPAATGPSQALLEAAGGRSRLNALLHRAHYTDNAAPSAVGKIISPAN